MDWGWMPGGELNSAERAFIELVGIGATVPAATLAADAIWQADMAGAPWKQSLESGVLTSSLAR